MAGLRRYWFRFAPFDRPTPLNLGCGVSANGYAEAIAWLQQQLGKQQSLPPIVSVVEDVDISTLDARHIVPNMESPVVPGIWFPKGYR